MKRLICCLFALCVFLPKGNTNPIERNPEIRQWVTSEERHIMTKSSSEKVDYIRFFLYTKTQNSNDPVEIDMNDAETLARSSYDFRLPTVFSFHGWKDSHLGGGSTIKNAILQSNKQFNIILVDWSVFSKFENYTVSHRLCSTAGKTIARFIDWMHDTAKMRFDMLTFYGHSMGAHVAGFAAKNVQRGKVHTIIGLDPALPLFPIDDPTARLAATDAEYVETIHTNGGQWGFFEPIGQTAFYPNGGKYQPGCEEDLDGMCSHIKVGSFISESLRDPENNNFHAVKCAKLEDVETGECNQFETILRMGDPENRQKTRGIYYLETNIESPFALGKRIFRHKKL